MGWMVVALLWTGTAAAAEPERFELAGLVDPPGRARVSVQGSTAPFSTSVIADSRGRFRVKKLLRGTYTVAAFSRSRGEARQTVEVGPGTADARRRVSVTLLLKESEASREFMRRRNTVSTTQLAVPDKAIREWEEAHKRLERRDAEGAARHLEKATEIAPHFAVAWNTLGTVYYQTRRFTLAESAFRRSLAADATLYEPLVNLGGVLINLNKMDEALEYNLQAVLKRPGDALANSQLGQTYFALGKFDLARKYLQTARDADPAHFSHPQLLLAEIELRLKQPRRAADHLEDFLRQHPDAPAADQIRTAIARLRQ